MHKLKKYILNHLSLLFLSIFLPLFAIASVIFLIKMAAYTAVIQITLWELIKLYIFVLPEILFYTLPITFFIATTLTLYRLSSDNETIVLFSLGIHPKFIFKTLLTQAALLTTILLFNFLIIFPHAKVISSDFISYKKSEAKFNLSASEFGHSFGSWLLYIGKENKDGSYGDVFLFNKNKDEEILIGASRAEVINDKGILRLKLSNGEGYSYSKEKFSQVNFETMFINDTLKSKASEYETPFVYWTSDYRKDAKKKMLINNLLISFFPVFSLFIVLSLGVVHTRHQKSRIYLYLFLSIAAYYGAALGLQKPLGYYTLLLVPTLWLAVTYAIYKKTILKRF